MPAGSRRYGRFGNLRYLLWPILWWGFTVALYCAVPDHAARWNDAKLRPEWTIAADRLIARWQRDHAVYERLEAARTNGVPAQFIFGFHERESSGSFKAHLHEGSPLTHRTRFVPRGRPVAGEPPFDWFTSALDALYDYEHLERRDWRHLQSALQAAESYNGLGYQAKGRVSPYLWSGTSLFSRGKYTGDGHFDANARDGQIGVCAILLRMRERGIAIPAALDGRNGLNRPNGLDGRGELRPDVAGASKAAMQPVDAIQPDGRLIVFAGLKWAGDFLRGLLP